MSKVIVDEIQTDTTDGNVRIIPNGTGKLEVKGAGGDDAMIRLNCSAQTHGVKLKSPNHSAGQSYTMILPDNNIEAGKFLKVKSVTGTPANEAVGQLEYADVAAGVTSDAQYNTVGGTNAGNSFSGTDATNNTLIGYDAGTAITTGDNNSIFGYQAGLSLTSGGANTAIGRMALYSATTVAGNVAIGNNALKNTTTAYFNVACGQNSLFSNTTGENNTCIGTNAGYSITTGDNNICIGKDAGYATTTRSGQVLIGSGAGKALTNAFGANFIGFEAGLNCTTGGSNILIGYWAGKSLTTGESNVFIGSQAGEISTGSDNTAVGYLAGIRAGGNNTCIGRQTGYFTTGNYNTFLGNAAGYNVSSGAYNLALGNYAGTSNSPSGQITTGSGNVVLGDNNISNLYCADTSISSSDARDKTDVTSFTIGLNWIEALRPVTYRWDRRTWYGTEEEPYGTPDGSKKRQRLHIGFLAQEALEVEKANGYGNSNDDSLLLNLTDDGMSYGMKYERLVPILVNAIKELSARVKTLEGG